jgi:FADH2 O2-dependent halogenase
MPRCPPHRVLSIQPRIRRLAASIPVELNFSSPTGPFDSSAKISQRVHQTIPEAHIRIWQTEVTVRFWAIFEKESASIVIDIEADIAVIGAGFSGSLMAMLLHRIGLRPVLIDRGTHPRFAVGESSTPVANLILEGLARRYDLPRVEPLANYARWKSAYPEIVCGLKRGFSYFHHSFDQDFQPREDRANELLVAASLSNDDADTHWLRSDFDHFLAREAESLGIPYFDRTSINEVLTQEDAWVLPGETRKRSREAIDPSETESIRIRAKFLIDASGEGGFLARHLGIGSHPDGLKTRSRALYSHFTGVLRWSDLYFQRGGDVSGHPYPCDDAALHHVFDGGWMWVLPFDNGVTSAGFALDLDRFPRETAGTPEEEWARLMSRLPAVAEQFANATPIVPWRQTGRMQRRLAQAAGRNWAMLPNTAAFHDPLHSTGNTFTLVGIERLIDLFEHNWGQPQLSDELQRYDELVQKEVEFIDLVVSGSFAGFHEFERMIALSMFYFATAIWSEEERRAGRVARGAAYLSANRPELRAALEKAVTEIGDPTVSSSDFSERIRDAIRPFNRVGLFDPKRNNMYPYEFS